MVNEVWAEPWGLPNVAVAVLFDGAPMTAPERPDNRSVEHENQHLPAHEGEAPRPATEPKGSEGSSNSGETATDPATGKPNA